MELQAWERLPSPVPFGSLSLLAQSRHSSGRTAAVESFLGSYGRSPFEQLVLIRRFAVPVDESTYQRFVDQVRVLARISHNNLVPVLDGGCVQGQPYVAYQHLPGVRLAALNHGLPVELAVYIVREVLRGLHCAHSYPGAPVLHRALAPSKVLLEWNGGVRVSDFFLETRGLELDATLPGIAHESIQYLSPEQADAASLDARCDVFACGVLLWELLTQESFLQTLGPQASLRGEVCPAPSERSSYVDKGLDAIVMRALRDDPAERWPDAHAMMHRLSGWLVEQSPNFGQESLLAYLNQQHPGAVQREHLQADSLLRMAVQTPKGTQTPVSSSKSRATSLGRAPASPEATRRPQSISTPVTLRKDIGATRPLVSPPEKLKPDSVVAQRYRIEQRLGKGGMGTVFRAKHLQVGRPVALKVLARAWSYDEDVARRFRAEARAASAAGHPNIVEVFDAGELSDGRLFFVMEYLEGENLYDKLRTQGPMQLDEAIDVMLQVARAVKAAHDVNVIHRDLKPDNVMLVNRGGGESRAVKVLDFGISAMIDERNETRWTKPGHAVGTPEYMAPEQARGVEATHLFDVYAWGVMFFEMICGSAPLTGTDFVDVMAKKNDEPAPSLRTVRSDMPDLVVQLIDDCLQIDPSLRPQSMGEVLVRLDHCSNRLSQVASPAASDRLPVASQPETVLPTRAASAQSRRTWVAGLVGALVLLVGLGSWAFGTSAAHNEQSVPSLAVRPVIDSQDLDALATPEAAPVTKGQLPKIAALVPRTVALKVQEPVVSPDEPAREIGAPENCRSLESRIAAAQRDGKSSLVLGLLRSGKDRRCWRGKRARKRWARWRVHALKEQKQWSKCLRAAQPFAKDPEIRENLVLCRARERMQAQ